MIEPAGTQMPEYLVDDKHCGTHASGWLNGTHPTTFGVAVDSTVCFHWASKPCYWSSDIQIMNCETYFIYYLPNQDNACSLRYCAEGEGINTTTTTTTITTDKTTTTTKGKIYLHRGVFGLCWR